MVCCMPNAGSLYIHFIHDLHNERAHVIWLLCMILSRKYDNVSTPTFVNDSRRKPGKKETYSDFYSIASVDAHHCHCI